MEGKKSAPAIRYRLERLAVHIGKQKIRDVTLRLDELAAIWRLLDDSARCKSDPVTVAALKILILTGQREREVTDAEWSEFDLKAGLWKIPATRTKKERAHLVHLAPQAIAILEGPNPITGKERHVFASPLKPDQAVFGRSVNNALITRLPDLGIEPFIGHKIANHVLPGVLGHYNHNSYEAQREAALKAWANRIEELVVGENIVQLQLVA